MFLQHRAIDALPLLEHACHADPTSASARLNLAAVYADLRRFTEARREAEEALRLDPSEPRARELLKALPQRIERAAVTACLRLTPGTPWAERAGQSLGRQLETGKPPELELPTLGGGDAATRRPPTAFVASRLPDYRGSAIRDSETPVWRYGNLDLQSHGNWISSLF